ncbi:3-phosphoshikimate 1-carboxyvinyltransferase [Nonlabens xiamenensis]|uniref:3-phosphoshikimate 1-carboxyvinyltransferase n=1 Tax=Nonlabens xiamenensis TaxID=2341043 RepID=UPI000F6082E7|nr:3-phosphoshikimate 1-carboxyvinyltransferase [Nonlabens xiamenensis]
MDIKLEQLDSPPSGRHLRISGSKSESNRWLILQAIYQQIQIHNLSDSDDSHHLKQVLYSKDEVLDIGHAGTAMRFGTAYFACQPGRQISLTGSDRMKQRPIGILVEALRELGADIKYLEKEGYPPLSIKGKKLLGGELTMDGSVSSQYLTALLLMAPTFEYGLLLKLKTALTSRPYLEMTVRILQELGVDVHWSATQVDRLETIVVKSLETAGQTNAKIESDWSSAGYWYAWTALQDPGYTISISSFLEDSLQGDRALAGIYTSFGVTTEHQGEQIVLTKTEKELPDLFMLDMTHEPDQAQTVFATCLGLGVNAHLTGLHTLKIKETDRIEAMKLVGSRFRESEITTTDKEIKLNFPTASPFNDRVVVDTFQDHRMAMAFAPLVCRTDIIVKDAQVVTKSYKSFWEDLSRLNVSATEI